MSQKEKLIERLCELPKDFTLDEMITLLGHCGYRLFSNGGSSVKFVNDEKQVINFHRPHPDNILKKYVLDQVIRKLTEGGFIE